MNDLKSLYDLFFSPLVTPYNLLENAKLDNYSYVNYYKGQDGLIAEMKCKPKGSNKNIIYYYHFDSEDFLQKIYANKNNSEKHLVFERNKEKENMKLEILQNHKRITESA